jgi:surface protein
MSEMFSGCRKLASIEPLSEWDVSNVWDMSGLFFDCQSLDRLTDLSKWNANRDCILEAFYAKRVQFSQPIGKPPIGPIISMLGWEIKQKSDIDRILNNNFPKWLIDRHRSRGY